MRYKLIDAQKADVPVYRLCNFLAVSPSGYYAWRRRQPSQRQRDDMVYLAHIRAQSALSNGTYGSPRMHAVHIETIRYYENIDIMPAPPRTHGGHRCYGAEHAKRLLFISRSRSLGFTTKEIRSLLGIADGNDITCADVRELTLHHAEEAQRKIVDLRKLERTLRDMAAQCHGNRIPDCPIVDGLFG